VNALPNEVELTAKTFTRVRDTDEAHKRFATFMAKRSADRMPST